MADIRDFMVAIRPTYRVVLFWLLVIAAAAAIYFYADAQGAQYR